MTPEQKAAFINGQVAMCNIELEGMIAENKQREQLGHSMAYTEQAFNEFAERWGSVLGWHSMVEFFRD